MERIGFIGLGIMGKMAARLVRAGFPVVVHNRSPAAPASRLQQLSLPHARA